MINLLKNIIRLGTITQIFNKYGIVRSQATSLDPEDPENVVNLQPYGFNACPPIGSQIVIMSVFGHAEHKYGIPFNPTDANIQKLQAGESIVYNNSGSKIYLKADGTIEITPSGSSITITVADTNIVGNLNVDGNIDTTGVYKVDGVQVVTSQQPPISPPTGGATIDSQARTAINSIITTLTTHGLIS